jgi:hypothetical protein
LVHRRSYRADAQAIPFKGAFGQARNDAAAHHVRGAAVPEWVSSCLWIVGLASLYSIIDYTYALWKARAT